MICELMMLFFEMEMAEKAIRPLTKASFIMQRDSNTLADFVYVRIASPRICGKSDLLFRLCVIDGEMTETTRVAAITARVHASSKVCINLSGDGKV